MTIDDRAHYVGTQADARALERETGQAWAEVNVPTDKAGLIGFLNEHAAGNAATRAATPPLVPVPVVGPDHAARTRPTALDASSVLARMDNPEVSIDAIVEGIASMKGGYALKRVASAVAIRFEQLSR